MGQYEETNTKMWVFDHYWTSSSRKTSILLHHILVRFTVVFWRLLSYTFRPVHLNFCSHETFTDCLINRIFIDQEYSKRCIKIIWFIFVISSLMWSRHVWFWCQKWGKTPSSLCYICVRCPFPAWQITLTRIFIMLL